ncbi:hypothetical protein BDQ17DRAFT_1332617 [Cyathus striatus]|nr:hypothetical protein BDQ17DRAFT_1332617 [Cyathus striatus]
MTRFLHIIWVIMLFCTPYGDIQQAMVNPSKVKSLVKQLSGQHAVCLGVTSGILAIYIKQDRVFSASLALGAILLISRISFACDGVNEESFMAQVNGIGPATYTVITMIPGIVVQLMLLYEIFTISSSIVFAAVIAFSCYILGIISVIAAVMLQDEVEG